MDYFGSCPQNHTSKPTSAFQSFWFNGLLWKVIALGVAILAMNGFNPSGSMDYFGRLNAIDEIRIEAMFQSFWFNGLLWKAERH